MSDTVMKIYLYSLVLLNVLFPMLYGVFWLVQSQRPRRPLVKRKLLWRDLFFLLSGLVGWYLFSSRLLGNSLVMLVTIVMLVVSFVAAESLESNESKSAEKDRAT
ncbi:MAG TPA: hypothetical protein VFM05_03395 [Candidatus Saccharimonadales bacterium]|nr:hypothetical protein [Candidatus Saccharimonadales bacterium]